MKELIEAASDVFIKAFSRQPDFFFHAPGRINLIGEHTDYNQGFVLPCAIDRNTVLAVSPREDNTVCVTTADLHNTSSQWTVQNPIPKSERAPWSNYLRGVCEQFLSRQLPFKGMDIVALGNIPQGAGLSSSASFTVAFSVAVNHLNNFHLSSRQLALICQAAENQYVGCQCGIMDQLISAAGQAQKALLIDCADISYSAINLPQDAAIVVVDSKVTRGLVSSEYNTRRLQCEQAVESMGLQSLRQASIADLQRAKNKMHPLAYRRAKHVITENTRTLASAEALKNGDYQSLSRLMAESHQSMRDDFEITVPPIDFLVEKISAILGEHGGARMTGGGFGGCVVALTSQQKAPEIMQSIGNAYTDKTGLKAEFHLCVASDGAGMTQALPA
ncbi:MAG: galactokinase [Cellvibrionaceae bacterium]|nr:galactokinase [Cellvibrionaceae bacterium]